MTQPDSCPTPKWQLPSTKGSLYKLLPSYSLFSHQIQPQPPIMSPSSHTHPSYRWENYSDPRKKAAHPRLMEELGAELPYPDSMPAGFSRAAGQCSRVYPQPPAQSDTLLVFLTLVNGTNIPLGTQTRSHAGNLLLVSPPRRPQAPRGQGLRLSCHQYPAHSRCSIKR